MTKTIHITIDTTAAEARTRELQAMIQATIEAHLEEISALVRQGTTAVVE